MAEEILDGVRIVDLSWGLAGPAATQRLPEAGTDVVKLERPGGDPMRRIHPAAFATSIRSTRSVALDLEQALLPSLHRPGGRVIAVASTAARYGVEAAYGSIKGAMSRWVAGLASEIGPEASP